MPKKEGWRKNKSAEPGTLRAFADYMPKSWMLHSGCLILPNSTFVAAQGQKQKAGAVSACLE